MFMDTTKTLKLRIKDKHAAFLGSLAREVNTVFNFCNEVSMKASNPYNGKPKWLSGYDLQKLVNGATKGDDGFGIPSQTLQQVCEEYATRRKQFKKHKLNWRVSNQKSSKYSLGWIPFKKGTAIYKAGQIRFAGKMLSLWDSYGLDKYELRAGSITQDPRGRWYLNVVVKVAAKQSKGTNSVGIDLGFKDAATCSDGQVLKSRWFREEEKALATAQRAGKKNRARAIHAKIANRRKDAMHKLSTKLVAQNAAIFVGDVSTAKMVKMGNGKSTLDAGWAMFKTMLDQKATQAGVVFEEVKEAYSTQTCSSCGSIEGPKGLAGLGVREWTCSCGAHHDRDVNAALNIRATGLAKLAISKAAEAKACETALNKVSQDAEAGHGLPVEGILAL
jgi:IS605 OrfB family transposase